MDMHFRGTLLRTDDTHLADRQERKSSQVWGKNSTSKGAETVKHGSCLQNGNWFASGKEVEL